MDFIIDVHTHTTASGHAYSTITENAKFASKKGIKLLGVTDHAPAMEGSTSKMYFTNFRTLPRELYDVELFMGAELNIVDYTGKVDLPNGILSLLDFTIASLHPPCIPFGTVEENTNAVLGVMDNPHVNILGHLGDPRYPIDVNAVFKKAMDTNTLIEMNNASLNKDGFRVGSDLCMKEFLNLCKKEGYPVIASSDAHFFDKIGGFDLVKQLFFEVNFPENLILNTSVKKFKDFLNKK